jgi:hypothetical protein
VTLVTKVEDFQASLIPVVLTSAFQSAGYDGAQGSRQRPELGIRHCAHWSVCRQVRHRSAGNFGPFAIEARSGDGVRADRAGIAAVFCRRAL